MQRRVGRFEPAELGYMQAAGVVTNSLNSGGFGVIRLWIRKRENKSWGLVRPVLPPSSCFQFRSSLDEGEWSSWNRPQSDSTLEVALKQGFGVKQIGVEWWFCKLKAVWSWPNHFTPLSSHFLIHKVGIYYLPSGVVVRLTWDVYPRMYILVIQHKEWNESFRPFPFSVFYC